MLIAKINNPAPLHYTEAFPNTSFPHSGPSDEFLAENGCAKVIQFKEHDRATQKLVAAAPYYEAPWVYTVQVQDKAAQEIAAEQAAAARSLQAAIVSATQGRLDAFARTRNYDNILSACTYATSSVPQFAGEGQAAVQARDATWAALYALLAEVQAGERPMPASFDDVALLLPALTWPKI